MVWWILSTFVVLFQAGIFVLGFHIVEHAESLHENAVGIVVMLGSVAWSVADRRRERESKPPSGSKFFLIILITLSGLIAEFHMVCPSYRDMRVEYYDSLNKLVASWHENQIPDEEWMVIAADKEALRLSFYNALAEAEAGGRISRTTLKRIERDLARLKDKAVLYGSQSRGSD